MKRHDLKETKRRIKDVLNKDKWEITIDGMMIIGKYFETNNDFINSMKVCKKYKQLVSLYHFNPINDFELFENMET